MGRVHLVSGLPRSGTSLVMQMLAGGGMPVLIDQARAADPDNPRGYYELEAVKATRRDSSWLAAAEGRAVKVVSSLLPDLPATLSYRVLFVRRPVDEVVASQRAMLSRRGADDGIPDARAISALVAHLAEIEHWLAQAEHMEVLWLSHRRLLADPRGQAARMVAFVGEPLDVDRMAAVVDPALYRQRSARPHG